MNCLLNVRGNLLLLLGFVAFSGCGGSSEGGSHDGDGGAAPVDATYTRATNPAPNETEGECWTTSVTGTLNGKVVDLLYEGVSGGTGSSNQEWSFEVGMGTTGQGVMSGTDTESVDFDNLAVGTKLTASKARLMLPTELQSADKFVCITGTSSVERASNHYVTTFGGVALLPDCSKGTAVEGELELCLSNVGGCRSVVSGALEGESYEEDGYEYSKEATGIWGSFGELDIRAVFATGSTKTTDVTSGYIMNSNGTVYCAGDGSTAEATEEIDTFGDTVLRHQVHLRNLKRIGDCSKVTGTDEIVVRSCTIQ